LVAGGYNNVNGYIARIELYDAANSLWNIAGSLRTARYNQISTVLPSGQVLVVGGDDVTANYLGSAELYDPTSSTWTFAASLMTPRDAHTATLLPSGKVLVVGGYFGNGGGYLAGAERYDYTENAWTPAAPLHVARGHHTATLLASGKVLVAGGDDVNFNYLASAELYDPASNTWGTAGPLAKARDGHTATLLRSGQVLVVGGYNNVNGYLASAELYDPINGTWSTTGSMATARGHHTATLLPSGKVLVSGGTNTLPNTAGALVSAELYDPISGTWSTVGSLVSKRYAHTSTLLPSGKVLVAGGTSNGAALATAEIFDPVSNTWAAAGTLATGRYLHTATLLASGQILVMGGRGTTPLASAELFDPGLAHDVKRTPNLLVINDYLLQPTSLMAGANGSSTNGVSGATTATGFMPLLEANGGVANASAGNAPVLQVQRLDNEQMRFVPNDETVSWTDTMFFGSRTAFALWPAGPVRVRAWVNGVPSASLYTTLAVPPGRVAAPVAVGGNLQASVTFGSVGDDGGAPVTSYFATAMPGNVQTSCNTPCSGIVIPTLAPGTYTLQVTAINAAGIGTPSLPSNSVTVTNNHAVTPSVIGNGSISPNTMQAVNDGATTSFTVTPNAGSHLVNVTGSCGGSLVGNTFTTNAITINCTVIANFAATTHIVTPSVTGNGSITPNTAQTVNDGATTSFTVTPNAGNSVVVSGTCGGSLVGNTYTTNAITADCTVVANFSATLHAVTPGVTGSGSISPNTVQAVNDGATTIFTVTPYAGNHLVNVTGSCGGSLVGNTYTTNAITADCTVVANFTGNVLVFMTQPADMPLGMEMGTIVVAEQDGNGNTMADDATVNFAISNVCGGTLDMGSVAMNNGVATLTSTQRFYTVANGMTITASTPGMSSAGAAFNVIQNSDLAFASGFDGCRP